jgi:hypothetical protein
MVQLEVGYHCIRNKLYTFSFGVVENIAARKDSMVYAQELLCYLAIALCHDMKSEDLQIFMGWFVARLFDETELAMSLVKSMILLNDDRLGDFVRQRCQVSNDKLITKSQVFR